MYKNVVTKMSPEPNGQTEKSCSRARETFGTPLT